LVKKVYLQQDLVDDLFDRPLKGFAKIIQRDANFLIDYVNNLYSKNKKQHSLREERYLNVVWEADNIEPILKTIFDLVIEKEVYFGISGHFCNSFFLNLPQEKKERAKNFLLGYCRENYENWRKINVVVDIARHSMKELFEDVLLLFVSLTQDADLFSRRPPCHRINQTRVPGNRY